MSSLLFAGWLAFAVPAAAQLEAEALTLEPGATCLTHAALLERITEWLGRPLDEGGLRLTVLGSMDDPRSVSVKVARDGEFIAQREFSPGPERCEDLLSAVAVAAAMMLKVAAPPAQHGAPPASSETAPLAATEPEPAEAQLPAPARVAPAVVLVRQAPRKPPEPARRDSALSASALLALGLGSSQSAGFDARYQMGLTPQLSLRAGLAGLFSGDEPLSGSSGTQRSRLLAGALDVCAGPRPRGRLQLDACAGLWAGRWQSRGAAFSLPMETHTSWLSLTASVAGAVRITQSISAVVGAALGVRPRHMELVALDPSGAVAASTEVPGLGVALGIGLSGAFSRQAAPR